MQRFRGEPQDIAIAGAPLTRLDPGTVLPLALAATPAFPGAIVVVDAEGGGAVAEIGQPELVASLAEDGGWSHIARIAARVAARQAAAVELIGHTSHPGPIEATFLPAADGERVLVLLRPLDFTTALHRSLAESRQRYKDLVEAVSDFSWETDRDARFRFVSPKGALGWTAQELVGQPVSAFVTGTDGMGQVPEAFRARAPVHDDNVWFRRPAGTSECLSVVAVPLFDGTGQWQGSRGLCQQVTEQHRRDRNMAQQSLLAQLTAHLARTMLNEADPQRALAAALSAVGLAVSATGGAVLRTGDDGEPVETASWGEDSREAIIAAARPLSDAAGATNLVIGDRHLMACPTGFQGRRNGLLLTWRERERGPFTGDDRAILDSVAHQVGAAIAASVQYQGTLRQSRTDPLTGLLNRRAFIDEAARRIAWLQRNSVCACLVFADLDNFKLVNDRRGHSAGDELLVKVCGILQNNSRSGDIVARLGGDEFVMWLEGVAETTAIERAAAIIGQCGALAHYTADPVRPLGVSLGLAIFDPAVPETLDGLILRADEAMYAAKHRGKNAFVLAAPAGPKA